VPVRAGDLRPAAGAGDEAKPIASPDLWARLDAEYSKIRKVVVDRPLGSFTAMEYAVQAGISRSAAHARLARMLEAGRLKAAKIGACVYYQLV
jgi:DNA-directed RNA polymerase specialized sigma24 family protein